MGAKKGILTTLLTEPRPEKPIALRTTGLLKFTIEGVTPERITVRSPEVSVPKLKASLKEDSPLDSSSKSLLEDKLCKIKNNYS